jgi:FxsC-like protein
MIMSHDVFFSYTHNDADDTFFKRFLADLEQEFRVRKTTMFRDYRTIPPGAQWPHALSHAIAHTKVFLYMHSPSFFASEACGREWRVFRNRIAQANAGAVNLYDHALIPVIWQPLGPNDPPLPQEVAGLQHVTADFPPDYYKRGLRSLLKIDQPAYAVALEAIASCVSRAMAVALPPLTPLPELDKVIPAFPRPQARTAVAHSGQAAARPRGPKYARYICVAASSAEMAAVRANHTKYNDGEGDWVPFTEPEPLPVDFIVHQVALHALLLPTQVPCPRGIDELEQILRAWRDANVVGGVIIDPWSLRLPAFREALFALERNPFPNWCRIFVWDAEDEETRNAMTALNDDIREVFTLSLSNATPETLDHAISNQTAMRAELERRLAETKSKVVKMLKMRPLPGAGENASRTAPPVIRITDNPT